MWIIGIILSVTTFFLTKKLALRWRIILSIIVLLFFLAQTILFLSVRDEPLPGTKRVEPSSFETKKK